MLPVQAKEYNISRMSHHLRYFTRTITCQYRKRGKI